MVGAPFRKWLRLDRDERSWLVHACIALPIVRACLSIASVQKVSRVIARVPRRRRPAPLRPERIVWAVGAAGARLPSASTCLSRALTAHLLMRREGVPSRVLLGIGRDEERLPRGHAWLELESGSVDSRAAEFSPFAVDLGTL